jgi:hypothetical protein
MQDLIDFCMWIFSLICWGLMWYYIVKALSALWEIRSIYQEAKDIEASIHERLEKIMHNVKSEKHADVHYWFDGETDRFLAQGKNLEEIRVHLKQRFSEDIFMVNDKLLLVGPEFEPLDISDKTPNDVGKYIADNVIPKMVPRHLRND